MKKLMMIISAISFVVVMACDNNNNRNNDSTQDRHGGDTTSNRYQNQTQDNDNRDRDGFGKMDTDNEADRTGNRSGTYDDDSRELSQDNTDGSSQNYNDNNAGTNDIPTEIRNKFENDDDFKNMKLRSGRTYERDGKTYYDITLEETDETDLDRNNSTTEDSRNPDVNQ